MPPLVLRADGSYEFSSSRGRWTLVGGRLHLSEAQFWGPGEIVGGDSVRFEYDYRGWRHTVTWTCRECASALQGAGTHTQLPPMPPETPQGYPPPPSVTQGGMPDGRFPETPGVSAPTATPGPGGSPPPAFDAGQAASSYGATQGEQAALSPPPPKCNPNIPKYSQPGCVE